jgi:hypothetical protein
VSLYDVLTPSNTARVTADSLSEYMDSANPPFKFSSTGRPTDYISNRFLAEEAGGGVHVDTRVVRGFIRRSNIEEKVDATSRYRLNFMYNPDVITRTYVSYLEQQALDPFNTVFGANNLVAPPGVLDFSFEMFFDRQIENANGYLPRGVLSDFDYFDLVVRGVIPESVPGGSPDNGILMVNPKNITVVFSPQISVQGKADSAEVIYQKFDHRMTPVRMTIRLSMKVFYIGPVRPEFTLSTSSSETVYASTVPYNTITTNFIEDSNGPTFLVEPSSSTVSQYQTPYTGVRTYSSPGLSARPNPPGPGDTLFIPEVLLNIGNGKLPDNVLSDIGNGERMFWQAAQAFLGLVGAAAKDGISITPSSGYRTYEEQVPIYNNYITNGGAEAAAPGRSRHGWGLAVDISELWGNYPQPDVQSWMQNNAWRWSFYVYENEAWHWVFWGAYDTQSYIP